MAQSEIIFAGQVDRGMGEKWVGMGEKWVGMGERGGEGWGKRGQGKRGPG